MQDYFIVFIAFGVFINSINRLKILNNLILITGLVIGIYVLTHGGHGPGILVDENDVGLVLTMSLPFAYFSMGQNYKKFDKVILSIIIIIILCAIGRTVSRGAMVGVLPTLFFIWQNSKRKLLTLLFIICILILAIALGPAELINEFESIQDTTGGTAGIRRYYWHLSIELFKKLPFFEVGAGGWENAVWSGLIFIFQCM